MHISKEIVHIAIAEHSVIIRSGISAVLERLSSLKVHIVEVASMEGLYNCMEAHHPDILIVNPMFCGKFSLEFVRKSYPAVKCIALVTSYMDNSILAEYEASLSIFDNMDVVESLFENLSGCKKNDAMQENGQQIDLQNMLSQREKEIVVCVVRGLTNKEIADELFLSVHTVMTHRRNISRKLQIHSVAGLTIYAIANKLIELKDLK